MQWQFGGMMMERHNCQRGNHQKFRRQSPSDLHWPYLTLGTSLVMIDTLAREEVAHWWRRPQQHFGVTRMAQCLASTFCMTIVVEKEYRKGHSDQKRIRQDHQDLPHYYQTSRRHRTNRSMTGKLVWEGLLTRYHLEKLPWKAQPLYSLNHRQQQYQLSF